MCDTFFRIYVGMIIICKKANCKCSQHRSNDCINVELVSPPINVKKNLANLKLLMSKVAIIWKPFYMYMYILTDWFLCDYCTGT